jgi:hypothetical protein
MPTLEIAVAAALAAAPGPGALESGAGSDAPESGATRIEPVERRPRFLRTPIPMRFTIPPANPRARRGRSVLQLAALIVAPPLIVVIGIMGMRSAADARSAERAAIAAAAGPVRAPRPADAPPTAVTLPIAASATIAPTAPAAASATAKATSYPRPRRPGHRVPHPARPAVPVAVNR